MDNITFLQASTEKLQLKTTSKLRLPHYHDHKFSDFLISLYELYNETTPVFRPVFFEPTGGPIIKVLLYMPWPQLLAEMNIF